jgi:hypothetical protein
MKQNFSKATEAQQTAAQEQAQQAQTGVEFKTVEELLRHDAAQVQPPKSLMTRLQQSLKQEIRPPAWWKRWFS